MFGKLLLIMVAGGAGTLARYGLSGLAQKLGGATFPWGTLVVNLAGCFLIGVMWALIDQRGLFASTTRSVVLIGFMGAFTTFSSFILDTGQLFQAGEWAHGLLNLAAQNLGGLVLFAAGLLLVRAL